jgi:hypothetical protein
MSSISIKPAAKMTILREAYAAAIFQGIEIVKFVI